MNSITLTVSAAFTTRTFTIRFTGIAGITIRIITHPGTTRHFPSHGTGAGADGIHPMLAGAGVGTIPTITIAGTAHTVTTDGDTRIMQTITEDTTEDIIPGEELIMETEDLPGPMLFTEIMPTAEILRR